MNKASYNSNTKSLTISTDGGRSYSFSVKDPLKLEEFFYLYTNTQYISLFASFVLKNARRSTTEGMVDSFLSHYNLPPITPPKKPLSQRLIQSFLSFSRGLLHNPKKK